MVVVGQDDGCAAGGVNTHALSCVYLHGFVCSCLFVVPSYLMIIFCLFCVWIVFNFWLLFFVLLFV